MDLAGLGLRNVVGRVSCRVGELTGVDIFFTWDHADGIRA